MGLYRGAVAYGGDPSKRMAPEECVGEEGEVRLGAWLREGVGCVLASGAARASDGCRWGTCCGQERSGSNDTNAVTDYDLPNKAANVGHVPLSRFAPGRGGHQHARGWTSELIRPVPQAKQSSMTEHHAQAVRPAASNRLQECLPLQLLSAQAPMPMHGSCRSFVSNSQDPHGLCRCILG